MLDPDLAFRIGGLLAMTGWAGLLVSLFFAPARPAAVAAARLGLPAILALAYILLIAAGWNAEGGGFGSIAEVRALFADDSALAAGWLHYLAFDLFVGAWIAEEGRRHGIHPLLLVPCLALTFLFGPAGLLLFLLLRLALRQPRKEIPA
ncbi:ABA4-like family protein [Sphingosinicella terrae]|uniref:ABA4-like family protein n=1 Tax=Sphingosinicella terrae TaxID=2172047 RepID=UPI000E0DF1AC|nr:ABA4-like family protein [Sphingosinicella terrae]